MIHTDLSALARSLTLGNFIGELVCWTCNGPNIWLAATIYNRLLGVRSNWAVIEPRPSTQRAYLSGTPGPPGQALDA
jgi:hypothetical protein